jgi:hypothetical protein
MGGSVKSTSDKVAKLKGSLLGHIKANSKKYQKAKNEPEFKAYNEFINDENNKKWLAMKDGEGSWVFSGLPEAKKKESKALFNEAMTAYDSRMEKEAQQQQIVDSMDAMVEKINEPKPTKQYPGDEESELERTKRLEALRAGILSTRRFKGSSTSGLLSPAQSIYGGKTKLGQ